MCTNRSVDTSMSISTCGQGQVEWWGLVVIVGAHVVLGLCPRGGGGIFTKSFSK